MKDQEIGWSNESKLLQTIGKQMERLTALIKVVVGTIPTHLYQLIDDALHRTVTDAEKTTWNGKQDDLGANINDALTGANSPSAANVFLTENDISPAAIALLPPATALVGTELIPTVQGGVNVTATPAQIKTYVNLNSANIWGYVATYANLPLGITATDPEVGDLVGVNATTGIWILGTQRRLGFYKRVALTGVAATDYGTSPYSDFSPVDITTATDTDITGLISGNGSKIINGTKANVEAVLTGNITSHTHSYLPNANLGTVNQVLHGNPSGALTFSAVVEDDISLSNVSTNNASITKHGFLDQLPGGTGVFKRGDGAWAAPASVTVPNAYIEESFAYTANVAHNIAHNFGARPLVQCITATGDMIIPLTINHVDLNTVAITFDDSATYDIILTMGSPPFTNVTIVSGNYVVLGGDYTIKQTVANKTITLPTAVGRTGKLFRIKNASVGITDVIFTGGQNADGYTDVTIPSKNSYDFQSDGNNYIVI